MRRLASLAALVLVVSSPLGTTAESTEKWDARFRAIPDAKNIGDYMRRLSAHPHHVGSPYDKENADWIAAKFREWGWEVRVDTYDVLFPTPKERQLELVAPRSFKAALSEPPIGGDPTSAQSNEQLPPYNAYSIDGDVTAPLVYVNYGRPVDYEELDRRSVSVRGAIVIARYGESWRGIKPKVAAEHGAVGCLIYSDPRDDGYFVEDVFPKGPMRNKDGVQRGSVADMPVFPGDPLTPNVAAVRGAPRLAISEAPTLTKIPVLPISYGDAQPLLAELEGPVAPEGWRGALPITYRIGPGAARVHLKVAFNWDMKPLYDVMARIPGSTFPDEWVLRGNHHDAWVNGASDPLSGTAPMLEEARALGQLVKEGWRPQRTIVYAAWDGEEPMLLGSTEWVEEHEADLRQKAVAYINTDNNTRGFLSPSGSHTLEQFVNQVARDIEDPDTKLSIWKRWQAWRVTQGSSEQRAEARSRADLRIEALGSGSDYSPFLQHNGTASLDLRFEGMANRDGVYHSAYDDFYHYTHFLDTDFRYGRTLSQTVGTVVIRLADADLLPFEFTDLADTVQRYVKQLEGLLRQQQDDARELNKEIDEGMYAATADPRRPLAAPKREEIPPAINFAPLKNAADRLTEAAERYRKAADAGRSRFASNQAAIHAVNARLIQSERQLIDPEGLPRRPWYRHLLYAPGLYTGYAVKTIPGVREGLEQKHYAEAEAEIVRAAKALDRETTLVNAAAADLERVGR
jgi:N-acetylated-alpha-linked acidic dipeptidase